MGEEVDVIESYEYFLVLKNFRHMIVELVYKVICVLSELKEQLLDLRGLEINDLALAFKFQLFEVS